MSSVSANILGGCPTGYEYFISRLYHAKYPFNDRYTHPSKFQAALAFIAMANSPFCDEAILLETPVLLRISAASLAQLKADTTRPGGPSISTHDALSALIWRTVLLIRSRRSALAQDLPTSALGSIFLPSDARRHLNLPPSYIGNAVYQLTAMLDIGTLLSPSGLQHAASAIRRAITTVGPALVSSYVDMTKERWIDWQFLSTAATTGVAMGTDWTSGSLYSDDWGDAFGPVLRYRFPGAVGEAFNCIMPKLLDGGAEVVVSVMPEEVEVLRGVEGFGRYAEAR